MIAYVLKRKDGTYWGIKSKFAQAVIFLNEGDVFQAWEANTTEDFEIVKVEVKELDKMLKLWDDSSSGA